MPIITAQNCKTTAEAVNRIPPKELNVLIKGRLADEIGRLIVKDKLMTSTATPDEIDNTINHKLTGFILNDDQFRCLRILITELVEKCPEGADIKDTVENLNKLFQAKGRDETPGLHVTEKEIYYVEKRETIE